MYKVVTGRFNTHTLEANYNYRRIHNFACIYCCPTELSHKICYDTPVFVIEMNNSTNKIEGIGLIRNKPENKRYYRVHTDCNNNRYIYIGQYYICRDVLYNYNAQLIDILEKVLFKGYTHSKRGGGLTQFPEKFNTTDKCNNLDIKHEIKQIFITHFKPINSIPSTITAK